MHRQGYRRFLELSQRLEEISQRFFFWRPVGSPRDMFDSRTSFQPSMLRAILDMRPGRSVSRNGAEHVSDARVAQMLDHFTQYVGSAPDQSPAVLCGIAHMQTNEGVWYPRGGTGAVPKALERLATQLGVELRWESACGASFSIPSGVCEVLKPTTASKSRWRRWSPIPTVCGPIAI